MREIKFRGMDLQGRWFYGLPCHIQTDKHSAKEGWYISNSVGISTAYDVRPETVTQYTGLLDKNGKEIYEGDIINGLDTDSKFGGRYENMKVDFYNGEFGIGDNMGHLGLKHLSDIEVIGNIYENPELLK